MPSRFIVSTVVQAIDNFPTGMTPTGQLIYANNLNPNVGASPWKIGNPHSLAYKGGYYLWPLLAPPMGDEDAVTIISRVAQSQSDRGVPYLLRFLRPGEQAAYLADPTKGSRFLGTAVHRATAIELDSLYPDRFLYRVRGPDFVDKTTGNPSS
jgi:hypothetical protein